MSDFFRWIQTMLNTLPEPRRTIVGTLVFLMLPPLAIIWLPVTFVMDLIRGR